MKKPEFNSFVFLIVFYILFIVGAILFAYWIAKSDLPEWFKFFLLK